MRIGLVEVLGAGEVNDVLEDEFEKELSNVEIKRHLVPTIDDTALGARVLLEDMECELVVVGYPLEDGEKMSQAFQQSVLNAQYEMKKHIFRVFIPADKEIKDYARAAAKEIVRYFYQPEALSEERSTMHEPEKESSFSPFAMFD